MKSRGIYLRSCRYRRHQGETWSLYVIFHQDTYFWVQHKSVN